MLFVKLNCQLCVNKINENSLIDGHSSFFFQTISFAKTKLKLYSGKYSSSCEIFANHFFSTIAGSTNTIKISTKTKLCFERIENINPVYQF